MGGWEQPVELAKHQANLLEGRPLLRLFGPAPLHQLAQLLQVTLQGQGGPEGGLLPPSHSLHNLCGGGRGAEGRPGRDCGEVQDQAGNREGPQAAVEQRLVLEPHSRGPVWWCFQGSLTLGLALAATVAGWGTARFSHLWG